LLRFEAPIELPGGVHCTAGNRDLVRVGAISNCGDSLLAAEVLPGRVGVIEFIALPPVFVIGKVALNGIDDLRAVPLGGPEYSADFFAVTADEQGARYTEDAQISRCAIGRIDINRQGLKAEFFIERFHHRKSLPID
jgi:hypothetical protein